MPPRTRRRSVVPARPARYCRLYFAGIYAFNPAAKYAIARLLAADRELMRVAALEKDKKPEPGLARIFPALAGIAHANECT